MDLLDRGDITKIWNRLYWPVWKVSEWNTIEDAKNIAREGTKEFHEFLKTFGINVNYSFPEESENSFPEVINAIKSYIESWELSDELPLLWLWNHQAFWFEASWAFDYFPTNGRVVLKDELLLPPYFWKWIEAIDPIVYYRRLSKYTPKEVFFFLLKKMTLDNCGEKIFCAGYWFCC